MSFSASSSSFPISSTIFVFVDMDGTVCDYHTALYEKAKIQFKDTCPMDQKEFWEGVRIKNYCKQIKDAVDRQDGFYADLRPIENAVETIKQLQNSTVLHDRDGFMNSNIDTFETNFQVFFLSSPEVDSKTCHSDKNEWIRSHFGREACKRLILSNDKTLVGFHNAHEVKYNVLIDDLKQKGANPEPMWTQIYKINDFNQHLLVEAEEGKKQKEETSVVNYFKEWNFHNVVDTIMTTLFNTKTFKCSWTQIVDWKL
jgi:5'(3')-deoxyribonucleotidase